MNETLKVWNDSYQNGHQLITNSKGFVLFERNWQSQTMEHQGAFVTVAKWGKWDKVDDPYKMEKAWYIKDITIEDAILEDYGEDNHA